MAFTVVVQCHFLGDATSAVLRQ